MTASEAAAKEAVKDAANEDGKDAEAFRRKRSAAGGSGCARCGSRQADANAGLPPPDFPIMIPPQAVPAPPCAPPRPPPPPARITGCGGRAHLPRGACSARGTRPSHVVGSGHISGS